MNNTEFKDEADGSNVINVTIKETGEARQYKRRAFGLRGFKNHAFANDFVEGAYKKATLLKAFCGALAAAGGVIGTTFWAVNTYIILPQQETMISRVVALQLAPVVKRLDTDEQLFRDHLIDVAEQRALYPTRADLRQDITEIKAMIQHLGDRKR